LDTFYRELQTPSRIEANTPTPQVEQTEEDFKSELTQSWVWGGDLQGMGIYRCLNMRLKPSDSYTLKVRVLALDPKTPRINLIPTLEGGQLDLP
jgi:hypothetical protein